MRGLVAMIFGAALAAGAALAQAPAPASNPCERAERRDLDFYLGDWEVSWEGGKGANRVVKSVGGCAIEENFSVVQGAALSGRGLYAYDEASGRWRMSWADDQGGSLMFTGGPYGRDFILWEVRFAPDAPRRRMLFEDVTAGAFTWRWQLSEDGKAWRDERVVQYARKAP